jgi:hypothetical protein
VNSEPQSAGVVLDYYVQEKKIFDVYASVSNTGTTETSKYQERIGILATQLTNNDDILAVDYQNSNFSGTQNVNGYYDARIGTLKDFRWRISGQWGQYYSSDLGLAAEDFNGSNWGVQGDLIWTFLQKGNSFFDVDFGVRGWNAQTNNELFQTSGNADFITLSGMLDALAIGETWAIQGSIGGMYTTTNADQDNLDFLGRMDTSQSYTTINGSLYGSFYLDPLLDSEWKSSSSVYKPLAHEIFGSLRGQYAFDYRLTWAACTRFVVSPSPLPLATMPWWELLNIACIFRACFHQLFQLAHFHLQLNHSAGRLIAPRAERRIGIWCSAHSLTQAQSTTTMRMHLKPTRLCTARVLDLI